MTERNLVSVETVLDVQPIEGADAIEQITIKGWTVVSKKDELAVGEPVVYFEIDSQLPVSDPRFAFLAPRGTRTLDDGTEVHRLRTAKLRGVYSQGLALPLDDFMSEYLDISGPDSDSTWESALGITKYDPPLPSNMEVVGPFPTQYGAKTDAERAQNLAGVWQEFVLDRGPWVASEKIDGTSVSVFLQEDGPHVCSRNWELKEDDGLYWSTVRKSGVLDYMEVGQSIRAEIFGPGVQGNPLKVSEVRLAVFAFTDNGLGVPRDKWPDFNNGVGMATPIYDLEVPKSAAEAIEQVNGIKSLVAPGRLAEGVVWHSGSTDSKDNGLREFASARPTWKAISNRYLAKNDG